MEIIAKLKFRTPCLGGVRRDDYDRMLRDTDGNVIFLPTWWRAAFAEAATAINRYDHYVNQIRPSPPVEGKLTQITRRYGKGPQDYKIHEGFDTGTIITVKFAIPGKMHKQQFVELLEAIGDYTGFSPYRGRKQYGFFSVVSISQPAYRTQKRARAKGNNSGDNSKGGRGGAGNATSRGDSSASTQMHPTAANRRKRG